MAVPPREPEATRSGGTIQKSRLCLPAVLEMHTHTHTHMHACMHAYIHTCTHAHIHAFNTNPEREVQLAARVAVFGAQPRGHHELQYLSCKQQESTPRRRQLPTVLGLMERNRADKTTCSSRGLVGILIFASSRHVHMRRTPERLWRHV